jgi:hypothetical protein
MADKEQNDDDCDLLSQDHIRPRRASNANATRATHPELLIPRSSRLADLASLLSEHDPSRVDLPVRAHATPTETLRARPLGF